MKIGREHRKRQVLLIFLLLGVVGAGSEPRRYFVMEETPSGTVLADLVQDLGLGVAELAARGAQVVSEEKESRLQLDLQTGKLILNEKLDREELCGSTEPCVTHFQVLLKKPLEIFQAELRVGDINDHSPEFPEREMAVKIIENSPVGTAFYSKQLRIWMWEITAFRTIRLVPILISMFPSATEVMEENTQSWCWTRSSIARCRQRSD